MNDDEAFTAGLKANAIRSYTPEDLPACIEAFGSAIAETAAQHYDLAQVLAWTTIDRADWASRRLSRPTWVAECLGQIAGFADLEPNGHLDMLYVHASHCRSGVASALLQQVETEARRQSLSGLFTEASITARPFFEARGFQLIAKQVVQLHGQDFINFRMQKVVA